MASTGELQKRRNELKNRESKVDKAIKKEAGDLKHLELEIKEERAERDHLEDKRKDLKKDLEAEIAADEKDKGKKPEKWEEWAESRRDELADMIDSCEARINRLVERMIESGKDLKQLKDRDAKLEKRIQLVSKRIERKKDSSNDLTKDFSMAEFDCNDGTPCPEYMRGPLKQLCEEHLQPLRDSGGSININSGYRTTAYNARIGGETNSYHVYTYRKTAPAADHVQAGRAPSAVAGWHDSHQKRPIGLGRYSSFTHLYQRPYESSWYG